MVAGKIDRNRQCRRARGLEKLEQHSPEDKDMRTLKTKYFKEENKWYKTISN